MTRLTFIMFLLLPMSLLGQKNIAVGEGILQVEIEKVSTLRFFEKITDASPAKIITITHDGEYSLENKPEADTWFDPENIWLEYYFFNLRVKSIKGRWINVVVNNQTGQSMWIEIGIGLKFEKWEEFLANTTAISSRPDFVLEVKSNPTVKSKTIRQVGDKECLEVIEIKGDWMRVKTNVILECDESGKVQETGWIQWKQNDHLAIGYSLTC